MQLHTGNTAADAIGCALPGTGRANDRVNSSADAMRQINAIISGDAGGAISVTYSGSAFGANGP